MLRHGVSEYAPLFTIMEVIDTKSLDEMQSPRVFVSDLPFRYLPKQLKERGKIIYVVRNPKDIAVSYYCHLRNMTVGDYEGEWNQFFPLFMEGNRIIGDWKNWFTVAQNEQFDAVYKAKMAHSSLKISFTK
ncbi:hypothetical protein KUTeg_008679 [Tegillarca granosa]|uniref:Sulfotransferase domain-containing protein n=1 Tax=Tegillarca granosa TaxID=220873 RepID=A0ABQ9F9S2_TEGGR|nr:hypothetical protein KUTeg_008679 [Tegillarca granosa]